MNEPSSQSTEPRCLAAILCVVASAACAAAEPVNAPPGGRDLLPDAATTTHAYVEKDLGTATRLTGPEAPAAGGWRIAVQRQPANPWSVQFGAPVRGAIGKDDRCLLLFEARAVDGEGRPAEALGTANVELKSPPDYFKLGRADFRVGTAWQTVIVPFAAEGAGTNGQIGVAIHLGEKVQTIEIAGLRLLDYGPDFPMEKLPHRRVYYEGREPDAPWRADAAARIERLRKGDFALTVVDARGKPVEKAKVRAVLRRHAFGFGTAITAQWMNNDSPDGVRYREILDRNFSKVVFENDLKPEPWSQGEKATTGGFRREWLDRSFAWLGERHIPVRGHYLLWAPWEPWSEKLRDDPTALRTRILDHLREKMPVVGNRVVEWDAVNHPAGWAGDGGVEKTCGFSIFGDVMKEARKLTPLPLWVNEDQLFRPGRQQDSYHDIIARMKNEGTPPDGIGNMAHFHHSYLPGVTYMQQVSDRFAALVPNLQITEYDVVTEGDEVLAADFTRDILTLAFSHPAYRGFVCWGFWEGSHWKPQAALWRKDWTPRPSAEVWMDLVGRQWHTDVTVAASPAGRAAFRGFLGRYAVTVTSPTVSWQTEVDLAQPGASVTLTAPAP